MLEDSFTTASGRKVRLAVYVEPGKLDQCGHAMAALKKSWRGTSGASAWRWTSTTT
jgi:aminopeptidase N